MDKKCLEVTSLMNSKHIEIAPETLTSSVAHERLKKNLKGGSLAPFWTFGKTMIGSWWCSNPNLPDLVSLNPENYPLYNLCEDGRMWPKVAATLAKDDLFLETLNSPECYKIIATKLSVSENEAKPLMYQWLFRYNVNQFKRVGEVFPQTEDFAKKLFESPEASIKTPVLGRDLKTTHPNQRLHYLVSGTCSDLIRCVITELFETYRFVPHAVIHEGILTSKENSPRVKEVLNKVCVEYSVKV